VSFFTQVSFFLCVEIIEGPKELTLIIAYILNFNIFHLFHKLVLSDLVAMLVTSFHLCAA
jgi:hypothetical protein